MIGVYRSVGQHTHTWDNVFAILLPAVLPAALFYLSMQRNYISRMTASALKA